MNTVDDRYEEIRSDMDIVAELLSKATPKKKRALHKLHLLLIYALNEDANL